METNTEKYYYGHKVSDYGAENNYVDYKTLANIVGDMILNNNIANTDMYMELCNGYDNWENTENEDSVDIFQYFIISDAGANFLCAHTNEIVYYIDELDMYLWGITHFGTAWSYVLTDIKLED